MPLPIILLFLSLTYAANSWGQVVNTYDNQKETSYSEMEKMLRDNDHKAPFAARKEFFYAFSEAQNYILSDNLTRAKRAIDELHKIKPINQYEESRIYLIDYWYEGKVGDKEKETEALTKLIPIGAGNIDADAFVEAGIRLFKRQYNAQDYGSAIETLSYLRKEPKAQPELLSINAVVKKLDDIANGTQNIEQQIKVDKGGNWRAQLLRPVFYLDKINGEIKNIDLLCKNKNLSISYKPESIIVTPEAWGNCIVKINSAPNTTFQFIQTNHTSS